MLNANRLWADLLSSMPLSFNLFGQLANDAAAASRAVACWWKDAPAARARLRFEYSAGNTSFARASADYRAILRDPRTFEARTFEDLLAVPGALGDETKAALRERYF
jgi:hypothetical protein